ncbi:NAD(P)/FAD-dependent oxidoreductase [Patulibacter brassicae]|uniref:NAD(P)/FAD-dependent oxidoreductase n=1 Tax=Patulibacter brassicae TaxID=1705717 RepID=A0ABU4VGP2_9ACTN|nr:NAD(P)/FAD-dependent oxidoreductase [Patulibacter brassicae]MDX8150981.1 NAD(P)/FAD-dependent oxidoreductase [Patulibacter brassicae]
MRVEETDVVVVGGRLAGSATAITLARGGHRVVVLEKRRLPSDTLSSHALVPSAVAETARLGALDRLLALRPPRSPWVHVGAGDVQVHEHWSAVDGIGYGLCIPRIDQDVELARTAEAAGADVRMDAEVVDVVWRGGRAAGVRVVQDGEEREIRARLVVGADGRRSTVAARVGAWQPYRASRNGRGAAYRYMTDPQVGTRWHETMSQWRWGTTIGYTFPIPGERMICMLMPPAERIAELRRDPEAAWSRLVAEDPAGIGERLRGAAEHTKIRSTAETISFFRASSGPGWALAGDAGHFKDPVIGSGQRDALRFGRRLGELVGPVLDADGEDHELDDALRTWERERDRTCMASYHWGSRESRPIAPATPLQREIIRTFDGHRGQLADNFGRVRDPERIVGPRVVALGLLNALHRFPEQRGAIVREALGELPIEAGIRLDRWLGRRLFRASTTRPSERGDVAFPPAPRPRRAAEPTGGSGEAAGAPAAEASPAPAA